MPRQYNIRPGGVPAPNVGQFGSAEIGLQSPTFRAQTAVDAGDNPFEYLQKILGVAGSLTAQIIDQKTADVKGQIAAIRIEEEREKEARAEERFAKMEQREAAAERDKSLRQEANVIDNEYSSKISIMRASGNVEGLGQLRSELIKYQDVAAKSGNPFLVETASKLLTTSDATYELVNNRIEEDNNKAEQAATQAASEKASELIVGTSERLLLNRELSEGIFRSDPASWKNAIEDEIISDMVRSDSAFMDTVWKNGSDAEKRGVERVIRSEVSQVFTAMSNIRMTQDRLAASNQEADALIETGRTDPAKAISDLDDSFSSGRLTQESRSKALRGIVDSYVGAGETEQDKIRRAIDIGVENADDVIVSTRAQTMLNKSLTRMSSSLEVVRRDPVTSGRQFEPDPSGDEVGWRQLFDTKEELADWFMKDKMGIPEDDVRNPKYGALNPVMADLLRQFEQDDDRTTSNTNRRLAAENRKPTLKAQKSANDAWLASPLKQMLETRAFVNADQATVDSMMIGETGYAGNAPPRDLMTTISSLANDPQAFRVVNSFFAHFPPSNPAVANAMEEPAFRDAWIQSVLYRDVIQSFQGDEESARREMTSRMSRLSAYRTQQVQNMVPKETKDKIDKAVTDGIESEFETTDLPAEDLLLVRTLADMHIGSGGDPTTSVQFARKIMARDLQYSELPMKVNGVTKTDLVYNPVKQYVTASGRVAYRVLPDAATMAQPGPRSWNRYIESHKAIASEYIGSMPAIGGRAGPDDTAVVSIELSTDPIEMESGGCSIIATSRTGVKYRIPSDRVSISLYNYERWKKSEAAAATEEAYNAVSNPTIYPRPSY